MRLIPLLAILALALVLPVRMLADEPADDPLGADPKLDRKVTIACEGQPVGELLAVTSGKVGLALRADPAIADEKVVVFGPPRPLRATLTDLALLFGDSWRHYTNVEGMEQYVLYREPKAFRYEERMAAAVTAMMQARLTEQVHSLSETSEQFAKRPETDWIKQNFKSEILHGRTATRLYAMLDLGQRNTLFAQGYLNVSFAASGAAAKDAATGAFKEAVAGLERENERLKQEAPDVHVVIDAPENLDRFGVRFNLHHENNAGLSALVVQVILGKASYMTMGEFDSHSQWLLPPHGNPYSGRMVAPTAELPSPEEVLAASKVRGWVDQLHALADKTGRPVMADWYRAPALLKPLETPDVAAASSSSTALDALCAPAGYLWWLQDRTLLFRKRDWFRQRLYEPPDRWIRAVAKRVAGHKGVPTFGDLASLQELAPAQLAGLTNLLAGGGGTPTDVDTLAGIPDLLQVLGALVEPAAPVYVGSPDPELAAQIGLPRGPVLPALRPRVAQFLSIRRQLTTPTDVPRFKVCATCYGPIALDNQEQPSPDPRGKVTVVIEWNPGPGQIPYDQQIQLYLPTELPGDRTGRTRVELE